jgi:glycerol-3-phosphate dehydrogenase
MIRNVARLGAHSFDLLVIGGGIYGLTIAADAAQRGLSVALIERGDFGSGNSFNHLRTIHGGLRYLQALDLARARESIRERRTLARIAPHAVRPLPFVLPLTARLVKGPMMMRLGLLFDALLARDRNDGIPPALRLPAGQVLSPAEARRQFSGLRDTPCTGAAVWYDYQTIEADRLTLAWAFSAAAHGAVLANYVEAQSLHVEGAVDGGKRRVAGAHAVDRLHGGLLDIAARLVVNATGGAIDELLGPAHLATRTPMLQAMNLVTRLPAGDAAIGGFARSGRALFMVPWRGRVLFGTWESTATCDDGNGGHSALHSTDIDAFVAEAADAFPDCGLTRDAVTFVHHGVVPAVVGSTGRVALEGHQRIHDHAIDGLISVAGTKYTTARAVAERVVDLALVKLGREPIRCRTATTPLPGTDRSTIPSAGTSAAANANRSLPGDVLEHLAACYGPDVDVVLALVHEVAGSGARVDERSPVIGAQLIHAMRHEMAATLADAVIRRTPLGALGHPGADVLSRAADVLSGEAACHETGGETAGNDGGWDPIRRRTEVDGVDAFYRRATGV